MWGDKRPEAAARLATAKEFVAGLVEQHQVPAENLLQPDALRRTCWEYRGGGEPWSRTFLRGRSARAWQIDLMAAGLAQAFEDAEEELALAAETASGD